MNQCQCRHLATAASNLLNRHIEKSNSETLIGMLARVGVRVEVPVSRDRCRRFNVPREAARCVGEVLMQVFV
jgi:hypothetical protein